MQQELVVCVDVSVNRLLEGGTPVRPKKERMIVKIIE